MKRNYQIFAALLLAVISFLAGSWSSRSRSPADPKPADRKILRYICPMHPQYVSDKPGEAPCCGMRLEPVYEDGKASSAGKVIEHSPEALEISPAQQQMAGVRTGVVEKVSHTQSLRTPGRVAPDERLVYRVNAALDGWVRETSEYSTGSLVKKNERLATVYSPEYRNAQVAFITAVNRLNLAKENLKDSPEQIAAIEQNLQFYTDTLRNLGVGEPQLEELRRKRQQTDNIHVVAPAGGFVLARNVSVGQRFVKGDELYRVADLQRVWVLADLFERESRYVRPGQPAAVLYLGRTYHAKVSEVLPQFDPNTRTLKVRLELDNPGYLLRPDMFVDVEFPVTLPAAVTVPSDAVLDSGLRKTVFVDRGGGYFESRTVETGWRMGGRVEIVKGLQVGERIAVSGNFLLDSESRIKAAAMGVQRPAKDLICGMDVDQLKAAAAGRKSEYRGASYYFCSDYCKKEFDKDPQKFLAAGKPGS